MNRRAILRISTLLIRRCWMSLRFLKRIKRRMIRRIMGLIYRMIRRVWIDSRMLILVVSFRGLVFNTRMILDRRMRLFSMIITRMITIKIIWMRITKMGSFLRKLRMNSKIIMTLNRTR